MQSEMRPFEGITFFELAPTPFLILDENGYIQEINRAATALLGRDRGFLAGQSFAGMLDSGSKETFFRHLRDAQQNSGQNTFAELEVSGAVFRLPVQLCSSFDREQDGSKAYCRTALLDLTERKRGEKERVEKERSAAITRLYDEFLAILSHELRTPIQQILGRAQMLSAGTLSEEKQVQAIQIIERNALHQARLVDRLLECSNIVFDRVEMSLTMVDLSHILQQAWEAVLMTEPEASELNFSLLLDHGGGLTLGDEYLLHQIFTNLLSNAVKFTPSGGNIRVELRRIGDTYHVILTDSGRGIVLEQIPNLFQRFWQADTTSTRRHRGLGIGLALVRNYVELHDGTVDAMSEGLGLGSTFRVVLPVR